MGPKDDPWSTVVDIEIYLFGITFPIACVLCIAILVQRIRRRARGGRFTPAAPKRQMDPNPPNYGGKERADLMVGRDPSRDTHPPSSRDGLPPLPSACDILQPLSHLTPLPSSGYLAAVLGRERRARATTTTTTAAAAPACLAATGDVLGPVDPPPHANGVPGRGGGGARSIEPAWSDQTLTLSGPASPQRSGLSDESCAELDDPQSIPFSPTGWRRDDLPELGVGVSGAGEPQPVQKRSQTVQHLYGVDEEGARAWRRLMMEYS
ncbi:hypothetical protein BJX96DRAFT_128565 [Aspergillus floccosus]